MRLENLERLIGLGWGAKPKRKTRTPGRRPAPGAKRPPRRARAK
jgi:hypothetical protein